MEKTKVTKEMVFTEMVEIFTEMGRTDLVEFAKHEIELITKKREKARKTATGSKNDDIKALIKVELEKVGHPIRITDLMKASQEIQDNDLSNQRLSALMNQMVDVGELYKKTIKRVTLFSVNPIEDDVKEV